MTSPLHLPAAWLSMAVVAAVFVIVYPLVLGIIARRKLAVGWKYFWFGALVFLVFQLVTRVPIVLVFQNTVLAPLLRTSTVFLWAWLVILVLTAGLFEEFGRYAGYRLFMRHEPKSWSKAVMFGLGHGGLESMVLVGGQLVISLIELVVFSVLHLNALPATQKQTIIQVFASINAQPFWFPLLAAWERLWTLPVHVALSVIVLQVFRRQQIVWLFLAIFYHALVDFMAVAIPQIFGSSTNVSLLVEGGVCVFGLISLWMIWRLREPGEHAEKGREENMDHPEQ